MLRVETMSNWCEEGIESVRSIEKKLKMKTGDTNLNPTHYRE